MRDHFLIGDMHTAALVSAEGVIDFLCLPHFDSPAMFAGLLDNGAGRFWIEAPGYKVHARYSASMPIVEHVFQKKGRDFLVKDFMVPQPLSECDTHFLVRKIISESDLDVSFGFRPMADYGRKHIDMMLAEGMLSARLGEDSMYLHLPPGATVQAVENGYSIAMDIKAGEGKSLVFEYAVGRKGCSPPKDHEKMTVDYWNGWISKAHLSSLDHPHIIRSAITLKLLQFYPTGAFVAAPTTSLPSVIGGSRNWDYRYTWIRDSTFTLYALHILGFHDESMRFFEYIERIGESCTECEGDMHLMYTIDGGHVPDEVELEHLSGYKGSRPVRIGNAANSQFQLDTYGSLIDAYYFMWRKRGMLTETTKKTVLGLLRQIERKWMHKDHGIWEIRGDAQHYTYSKVMCWVGIDRALRMAESLGIDESRREKLALLREEIREWIWDNCYDRKNDIFKQHPGTAYQDATNFLFVLLQFLDRHSDTTKKIIHNTQKSLAKEDMVFRYLSDDNLPGQEGGFLLCSYWMIASLAAIGDGEKARALFENAVKKVNGHFLLPEQIDPATGEYLGNYPQAFSHMGLILASYFVDRYAS